MSQARKRKGVGRKPGSVEGHHSSGRRVATAFKQPTREQRGPRMTFPYLVLFQAGFTKPSNVATDAVRSYRTLSPLPASTRACTLVDT